MTLFPLMECCELLAIDPKTLHRWREQSLMSLSVHPTDGRRKCLTGEQVHQLAVLHGRLLPPDKVCHLEGLLQTPLPRTLEKPLHLSSEVTQEKISPLVLLEENDLSQKLSSLEALVIAQQHHLAFLTQALLLEREVRMDQHLSSGEVSAHPMADLEISRSRHEKLTPNVPTPQDGPRPLHPAELRARFLVLPPLIEYSASGTYVVISSQEGEIPLIPESPEWFEWFRTLSSFRFVGKEGCFGACRGYNRRPTRLWHAHRTIHQHQYGRYLGVSEHLTIAHLEAMAATLQAYV
jgi:hypothetical protein